MLEILLLLIFSVAAVKIDISILIALIAALGGAGGWVAYRKSGPESESINVATMRAVISELREELTRLSKENDKLRDEVGKLRRMVERIDR